MAELVAFGTGKLQDFSGAINNIPLAPNLVTSMNMFESEGVTTSTVIVDITDQTIGVYGTHARRSPAKRLKHDNPKQIPLIIPHIEVEDYIYPEDVEARRAPGTQELDRVSNVRAQRLDKLSKNFDLTHEYFRLSAVKGKTVDGLGNTLFDAYAEMGLTATDYQVKFDLTAASGIASKLVDVKRKIEQANKTGGILNNFVCLADSKWFAAFIENADIKEAYGNQVGLTNPLREDVRNGFVFQGITFVEYNGSVSLENGNVTPMIEENTAYLFPRGITGMFKEFYAPRTDLDYVNTIGQRKYAIEYSDPERRWLKLTAESNALMINTRPELVIKITNGK